MAGSINKVILIGHLGADPDIRTTVQGRTIASFSLATSKSWKDQRTGERRERTQWHRVVIFNENLAKLAQQYFKKGSKVYLEGELATRKWTDNTSIDRFTTEIVLQGFNASLTMFDSKGAGGPPPAEPGAYGDMPPDPDEAQYAGY